MYICGQALKSHVASIWVCAMIHLSYFFHYDPPHVTYKIYPPLSRDLVVRNSSILYRYTSRTFVSEIWSIFLVIAFIFLGLAVVDWDLESEARVEHLVCLLGGSQTQNSGFDARCWRRLVQNHRHVPWGCEAH